MQRRAWSQWQRLNEHLNPRLRERLKKDRQESRDMMRRFIQVADICLAGGGDVSFEWPQFCQGWSEEPLKSWLEEKNLWMSTFPGCALGVTGKDGVPAKKPWRIATSNHRLAKNLSMLKCDHASHAPLEGSFTRQSAFYPRPMCKLILESLFPFVVNRNVPLMPCVSTEKRSHALRLKPAWTVLPIEVVTAESGLSILGMVHKLLSRDEWKGRQEVAQAIEKEKSGLLLEGTRDESTIRSKEDIVADAQRSGETVHFASLMIIVSIKGYEKDPSKWIVKARIVFRGDAVRDQDGISTVFQDLAASAPSSISGLNSVIAFSMIPGNTCTTSDCVRAYIQSLLKTKHKTCAFAARTCACGQATRQDTLCSTREVFVRSS